MHIRSVMLSPHGGGRTPGRRPSAWPIAWLVASCLAAGTATAAPPSPSGLDRALALDYHKALVRLGVEVATVVIVDTRAQRGARRAEIAYRTKTAGTLAALRPEVVRVLGPSANPRLALDQVLVLPTTDTGRPLGRIIVVVPDYERWLRAEMSDDEFYGRWTTRGLR